jgi:hypothetical protein
MKIYRIASRKVEEYPNDIPEVPSEAIRLKDGRIFFTQNINHWFIYNYLKKRNIGFDQFDAIGWLSPDGVFLSKARGESQMKSYMQEGNWML